jgi:hypothetical protein
MLRSLLALAALTLFPAAVSAQGQVLTGDAASVVTIALRQARHDLVGVRKHVSVDRLQGEGGKPWSAEQAATFRTVLAADDSARAGVELCDSRSARCRLDDASEVVSVFAPTVLGDTATVVIQRTRLRADAPPRTRFSLHGNQYTLVRRGSTWKVVRTDLVLVT